MSVRKTFVAQVLEERNEKDGVWTDLRSYSTFEDANECCSDSEAGLLFYAGIQRHGRPYRVVARTTTVVDKVVKEPFIFRKKDKS